MQLKLSLVTLLACGAATIVTVLGDEDRSYAKQDHATVDERQKKIDVDFNGLTWDKKQVAGEEIAMQAAANRAQIALRQHRKNMRAQTVGSNGAVAGDGENNAKATKASEDRVEAEANGEKAAANAKNGRGLVQQGSNRAQGALVERAGRVMGGTANAGPHATQMRNGMANGAKVANFTADREYNLDAAALNRQQYRAESDKNGGQQGQYAVDSAAQTRTDGRGTIDVETQQVDDKFNYNFAQSGARRGEAELASTDPSSSVFGRRTHGWKCTAEKEGESLCRDNNGRVVGKVVANSRGDVVVTDENGIVIGRGKAVKIGEEEYKAVVMDGLAVVQTKRLRQYDCYSEVVPGGAQTKKIRVENLDVQLNGQQQPDGTTTFSWPSCFDVTADVTIPHGVDPDRLAFEFLGHVMPLGRLKCMDQGTCGRECMYCNACSKNDLLVQPLLQSGNVCTLHGTNIVQKVSMKICPPTDFDKMAFCGGFDRHIIGNDYFKYDGSINTQVRVWQRPENEETLRQNFFNTIAVPFAKEGLQAQFQLEKVAEGRIDTPHDNELLEWYVRKNGQETLLACRRGIVDYQVGGEKVNSNLMIDAFANIGQEQRTQLFSEKACQEWLDAQDREYAAYQRDATGANSSSTGSTRSRGSISDRFNSFLRGRGGRK